MSLLYKDKDKIKYSVEIKHNKDGSITFEFGCDGGKFLTDEILDGFSLTTKQLLDVLQEHGEQYRID